MIRKAIIAILSLATVMSFLIAVRSYSRRFVQTYGTPTRGVWVAVIDGHLKIDSWDLSASQSFWPRRVRMSLWLPVVLFAAYPAVAFIRGPARRWRRRRQGCCVECGQDLTGDVSGVCPKCGATTRAPAQADSYVDPRITERLFVAGRPNWDAISDEVRCGRCGYNLRLLEQTRCPECGLGFDWVSVLDRAARRSDFLFEHRWRERPVRSWLTTVWRSFRPFRFWKTVSLHHEVRAGPLWFLLLTSVPVALLFLHGGGLLLWLAGSGVEQLLYLAKRPGPPPLAVEVLRQVGRLLFSMPTSGWQYLLFPAGFYAALLVAAGAVCSLRQTLGKCQVRTVQVLRVVACAATPTCVLWAITSLMCTAIQYAGYSSLVLVSSATGTPVWLVAFTVLAATARPILLGIYLWAGLRAYLRLPRAFLLALAASILAFLLPATAMLLVIVYQGGGWG